MLLLVCNHPTRQTYQSTRINAPIYGIYVQILRHTVLCTQYDWNTGYNKRFIV